jgi:MSHA biogenesis protein MshO
MMRDFQQNRQRGFTLLEAITVLVIIGVLSVAVATFIRMPVKNYVDTASRAELTDQADLVLRRIGRDLRTALPNSIRVTADGHALEFIPVKAGGRYLAAEDGLADATKFPLDFLGGSTTFSVLASMASLQSRVVAGQDYVVVLNLGIAPQDAYQLNSGNHNIALIKTTPTVGAGGLLNIVLNDNPFSAAASLTDPANAALQPSPTQRFQVVSKPVYYSCESQGGVLSLTRYSNYGFSSTMSNTPPSGASSALIARRLSSCSGLFNYSVSAQRTNVVLITLALSSRNGTDPAVQLVQQVHVDNAP